MGRVQGEEFSPTHFRTRTFSFYEIPIIHWQITPIHRSSNTPSSATLVAQKKWITPAAGDPTVWHLVSLRRGLEASEDADAALLVNQLRMRGSSGSAWRRWSQDHPELASVLWPEVAKLAQRELYILMPRLFELTRPIEGVEPLRTTMASYLSEEYASLVRDMRAAGRDDLAKTLMAEAEADNPDLSDNQNKEDATPSLDSALSDSNADSEPE